jgi:hypothetical protein
MPGEEALPDPEPSEALLQVYVLPCNARRGAFLAEVSSSTGEPALTKDWRVVLSLKLG